MKVDMEKFTSLLEIGFALHFAFPIIKEFWEKRFNDFRGRVREIKSETYIWRDIISTKEEKSKVSDLPRRGPGCPFFSCYWRPFLYSGTSFLFSNQ